LHLPERIEEGVALGKLPGRRGVAGRSDELIQAGVEVLSIRSGDQASTQSRYVFRQQPLL
jgi:hypothetical protein